MADNSQDFLIDAIRLYEQNQEQLLRTIAQSLTSIQNNGLGLSASTLQDMANNAANSSESSNTSNTPNQNNQISGNRYNRSNRNNSNYNFFDVRDMQRRGRQASRHFFDDLEKSLSESLTEGLFGSAHPIQDALKGPINNFARSLGTDVEGLGKELGKRLGQQAANAFKNNPIGRQLTDEWKNISDWGTNQIANLMNDAGNWLNDPNTLSNFLNRNNNQNNGQGNNGPTVENLVQGSPSNIQNNTNLSDIIQNVPNTGNVETEQILEQGMEQAANAAENLVPQLAQAGSAAADVAGASSAAAAATAGAAGAGAAAAGQLTVLGEAAGAAGAGAGAAALAFPELTIALIVGAIALDQFTECFGPAAEGLKKLGSSLKETGNRVKSENRKNLDLYEKRIKDDVESMVRIPFEIMEDAANKAMQTWDSVLNTITSTQGITKDGLQELWSDYAARLDEEGLSSVVSSADMMGNLEKVLESGLSGAAATEFAYIATVLNSAVPTQDFFQYADTYASLAANAIKNGASQEEALEYANSELEAFASNLIYAGREVSGGFSSSLKNGAQLFEDSAKIALTGRVGSTTEISGVLTSVSAIVGAIAPDLASGVVDAVVKAATGGNSSEITALRAMTGAGASNTAFLQALTRDPQALFAELFTNLANLQNMSSDNYMEVAEGLSSVFGISMDAFARVDFAYLADAISEMNVNNTSLDANLKMLQSGQTTATSEQMRIQKINEYMLEEGLAAVLDNEVSRAVQQHMWEEQLNRELQEATYAVDLQGAALEALQGVFETVQNILNFLNPVSWFSKVDEIVTTAKQAEEQNAELADIIAKGTVGGYLEHIDTASLLLTRNQDLHLVEDYAELMNLKTDNLNETMRDLSRTIKGTNITQLLMASNGAKDAEELAAREYLRQTENPTLEEVQGLAKTGNSYYNWGLVSKSTGRSLAETGGWKTYQNYEDILGTWEYQNKKNVESEENMRNFLATMSSYTADMAAATSSGSSLSQATQSAREESELQYLTQAELENLVLNTNLTEPEMSFEEWVKTAFTGFGITDLAETLTNFGLSMTDIRSKFEQYQTQATAKAEHARQLHEVQFWENVEAYNNDYFPNHFENEFLRTEWMMNWEVTYMMPIRDDLHQLLMDWEDYYIHHTAYTDATKSAFADAIDLANKEKDETGDSVLALAKALTENSNWLQENQEILKDPMVHANVLLSQILVVAEAIMQQNNNTPTTSIPTSLLGLGTGGY